MRIPEEEPTQTVLQLTAAIGPATGLLAQQWIITANREACQDCLQLLSYPQCFTPARVERAALRLLDYGVQDLAALRFLLVNDLDTLVGRVGMEFDAQLLFAFADVAQSHGT